jgi:hypothetical protein
MDTAARALNDFLRLEGQSLFCFKLLAPYRGTHKIVKHDTHGRVGKSVNPNKILQFMWFYELLIFNNRDLNPSCILLN